MKTWRERAVAARKRGGFTPRDFTDWQDINTCPAAESAMACGLGTFFTLCDSHWRHPLWELGAALYEPMTHKDFDAFDDLLDVIEDTALALKREQA